MKTAAVGQDRAIPFDEIVQASKLRHLFGTGAEHEMIGVSEDDVSAGVLHLIEIEALHRADRAHGHEGWCADITSARVDRAKPRRTIGCVKGKAEVLCHCIFHFGGHSRLASP